MSASLVGSEMCIRDSPETATRLAPAAAACFARVNRPSLLRSAIGSLAPCLLYTSDAADDM
eukprot:9375714-Alexandrium_andersonii.AAC.1